MEQPILRYAIGVLALGGAACATPAPPTPASMAASKPASAPASKPTPPRPKADIGQWGFDTTAQDTSVKPGDDFDAFANGAWKEKFSIPADLSGYGVFIQLRLDAEKDVHTILQDLSKKSHEAGSLEQKVGDAFKAWMDTQAIEDRGIAPLKPHLARIAKLRSRKAIMNEFATVHSTAPYGLGIFPNPADTTRYVAGIGQDGLGMPNRDYYLKSEDRFDQYRAAYLEYIQTVLKLAGVKWPKTRAKRIMAFEKKLAKLHWTPEDSRNIKKIYNPMTQAQLIKLAPEFDWPTVFKKLGVDGVETFVVFQPSAIDGAGQLVRKTSMNT
ncbi:MAG: M13 family metallopeptidase N-terminal domain-containing protein, partial [Myxococcota bacterium]